MTTTTKRPDGGELKPCPFCGSEAVISVSRDGDACNVRCSKWEPGYCLGAGPNTYSELTAIAAWNARTPTNESPAPQAEASEHAPWSEDEEDAERLLACASRRKKYGDENCECDEDGSCVECEYDMQDVLKKRYAPLKHTTTPAPQPPVEGLRDFVLSASFASRSADDSDTIFCEIYTPGYTPQKKGSFGFYVKDLRAILAALASPSLTAGVSSELRRAWLDKLNAIAPAVENLAGHQEQCDFDGVMVKVSRQALDEVLNAVNDLAVSFVTAPATLIEQSGQKETQTAKHTSSRTEASAIETAGGEA